MRSAIALAALSFLGLGADTINFDNQLPGALPPFWTATETHTGPAPRWEVSADPTAPSRPNVLKQVPVNESEFEFSLAIFDKVICRDGDLSVKFKIDSGRKTKTVGIVWRYQDPNNYYLLHFSAEEKNIVLFRVHDGRARPVPVEGASKGSFGVFHDIRVGQWYVAKIVFRGTRIRVLFGNRRLFEAEDSTFEGAGKTGVWTKGRTAAEFDDFRIDRKG